MIQKREVEFVVDVCSQGST